MRNRTLLALSSMLVAVAACGGGATEPETTQTPTSESTSTSLTPEVGGPETITIIQQGGCQMMGPNCPTYELDRDGTFRLFRTDDPAIVAESEVDRATVDELWMQLAETDIAALIERAGPGTCQACVDGIDTTVRFELSGAEVTLDSTAIAFDPGEPLLVLLAEATEAMAEAASLPIEQR